jgi:hypothetical protein
LRHPYLLKNVRSAYGRAFQPAFQEASERLHIELVPMSLEESTPSECQRVFAAIAKDPPDTILVTDTGDLILYRQLIVGLVEKSHLPAMYGLRDYVEAGGLMAYEANFGPSPLAPERGGSTRSRPSRSQVRVGDQRPRRLSTQNATSKFSGISRTDAKRGFVIAQHVQRDDPRHPMTLIRGSQLNRGFRCR